MVMVLSLIRKLALWSMKAELSASLTFSARFTLRTAPLRQHTRSYALTTVETTECFLAPPLVRQTSVYAPTFSPSAASLKREGQNLNPF